MRRNSYSRLLWLLFAIFTFANIRPAKAAYNSSAPTLAGLQIGYTYHEVLSKKGTPSFIGPSVENVTDINDILNPPPQTTKQGRKLPTAGGAGNRPPTLPSAPGARPTGAAKPAQEPMTDDKDPTKVLKGRQTFLIWLYEGDYSTQGIYTFVVFDLTTGVVTDIIAWQNKPETKYQVPTNSKVNLGDSFRSLIDIYGNSDPYRKLGQYIMCGYKQHQFTYCVNAVTGKIIGITLSNRGVTLLPGSLAPKEVQKNKNSKGPNKLPALPGGRTLPIGPNIPMIPR